MKGLISFIVGFIFALGLGYSGMTQTHVVKGFLDFFGSWNINLVGVMIGAIAVHALLYQYIKRRPTPLLDSKFYFPALKDIDRKLLGGAAIFGIGWGWAGICPGPGIVSLASGQMGFLVFVPSMLVGMTAYRILERKITG